MISHILRAVWFWSIGLICLSLPFFWWPRPFWLGQFAHIIVFVTALACVIRGYKEGHAFDPKRGRIHGAAGVLAFSMVVFSGIFAYRFFLL